MIHQKDIRILNVYPCNNKDSKYMNQNQKELNREIDKFTFLLGDFNTPFTIINRMSGQKISEAMEDLTTLSPNFT